MLYIILLKEDISNTDNPSGQKLTQVVNWEFPVGKDLRTVYCARARILHTGVRLRYDKPRNGT